MNVEWQRRDDDAVGARLQRRLEQPAALVVQDLVAALAGDDLGNQDRDQRVLALQPIDIAKHAADKRSMRVEQDLDRDGAVPPAPLAADLVLLGLIAGHRHRHDPVAERERRAEGALGQQGDRRRGDDDDAVAPQR